MDDKIKKIGILTGGGDCPGLNAVIRAVTRCSILQYGYEVIGYRFGYRGLYNNEFMSLTLDAVSGIQHKGGTILYSSNKDNLFNYSIEENGKKIKKDVSDKAIENIKKEGVDALVIIGGDGTLTSARDFARKGVKVIGVPKTIDNDLSATDVTFGFNTAIDVATEALDRLHTTAESHHRIMICEVMGRNAGWLTAAAALARNEYNDAPDLIYLPEVVFDKERFLRDIHEVFERKNCVVIAVSEGIKDANGNFLDDNSKYAKKDAFGHVLHSGTGKMLESLVFKEFQCKVRSIELNVLQRCAMHIASKTDLDESFVIGQKAIDTALANKSGHVMGFKRISNNPYQVDYISSDVRKIANLEQKIPTEWINKDGNNITQELYDYLFPLIQGEVNVNYQNGIPAYYSCNHLNK